MSDEIFKTFTEDISQPFTTVQCPKCGYRGQVTSEWAVLSGQFMTGSCDWCNHMSKTITPSKGECDFLVETWQKCNVTTLLVSEDKGGVMKKESVKYLLSQAMHELSHPDCVWERVSDYIQKAEKEIAKPESGSKPTEDSKTK